MAARATRTSYELARLLPGAEDGQDPRSRPEPPTAGGPDPLRTRMAGLLAESAELSRDDATFRLYETILRSLVPDEARLLAALADGTPFPALDVAERTLLGGTGRIVLRNASTVGRSAGVTLADHVPVYVTRLVELGLADLGPEDSAFDTQYEVLVADEVVVEAARTARRPTFVRHTVRLSPFGTRLWRACDPAGE
ncbi:Abi-alpha family protein [Saccharomonospora cyanea]|uniref:DUF4393 domain-containing protein n=1 Tax=Saccharomonospora cyanea NA-134 TaxID=882082 RepID=H5XRC4_9PSEU|nr:hypothetical protein SaccyDRAFT_4598 [Saccharomonospora cyanea NA-134]